MVIKNQKLKRKNKSLFFIIGSLLLLIGISIISIKLLINMTNENIEEDSLNNFYEEQIIHEVVLDEETKEVIKEPEEKKENKNIIDYIAVIKIPKISLEKGLVDKNSYLNNVNRNIEILDESDMPDQEKGNFILASHSGIGNTAYFKNLHKLRQDDLITIHYNQVKYEYKVVNMYHIEKNGTAHIVRNSNVDTLTLITCVTDEEKQLIVIAEKVGV